MKKAVVTLMKLSKDERARMLYEARVKQQRDERARILGAREEGVALGRTEGKAEGKVEGRAEGKREKAMEIARKLLKRNIPIHAIMEDTGLSREEIRKLRT